MSSPRPLSLPASAWWGWLLLGGLLLAAGSAKAHGLLPTVLHLAEVAPERFVWSLRSPLAAPKGDAADPGDEPPLWVRFPVHCRATGAELDCRARAAGLPAGLRGHELKVEANPKLPREATARAELIVVIQWRDGGETGALLRALPEQDRLRIPEISAPSGATSTVLVRYLRLGLHHILGIPQGADHVLFLLALMLLVSSLPSLLWCVSAFTLGHSLTLAAAALDLVRLPAAPVEILIALSIVFVARERLPRSGGAGPAAERRQAAEPSTGSAAAMALAFGLLHGLGFASALAEAGLPVGQRALSLLAFNLGVEAGQLVWVLLCLLPWSLYRRALAAGGRAWLRVAPGYVIGCSAAALTLSRLWDVLFPLGMRR
jgi:hypothetical protein